MTQVVGALFEVLDQDLYSIYQDLFKQFVQKGMASVIKTCFMRLAIIMKLCC